MRLNLISRAGCHLCEALAAELTRVGAAFDTVDVDADAELHRLYTDHVPVLFLDGVEIARVPVDYAAVRVRLASAGLLTKAVR